MCDSEDRDLFRILVIGVGSIGERHARCFLKTNRARVSICETNTRLLNDVGDRYDIRARFSSVDAALSEAHDAAVIAVPANLHIPIAQQAAAANLHLLIEKPLSVTLEGIDKLRSSVEDANLTVAVAYINRAHPALAAMKNAIDDGAFGKPLQLVVTAGQHFPTYRPAYRETYYASRFRGGGAVQDALTHLVNAAEWLVGPVDSLVADANHQQLPGVDVEDVVNVLARHGNVVASYSLNQYQAPDEVTVTVVCEHGTARFESHKHRWRQMLQPGDTWIDSPISQLERDTLFVLQAESFLDAIAEQKAPVCSFDEGLQTLYVNQAILKSVESRSWQDVCKFNLLHT